MKKGSSPEAQDAIRLRLSSLYDIGQGGYTIKKFLIEKIDMGMRNTLRNRMRLENLYRTMNGGKPPKSDPIAINEYKDYFKQNMGEYITFINSVRTPQFSTPERKKRKS
jgi:hypothetical protein